MALMGTEPSVDPELEVGKEGGSGEGVEIIVPEVTVALSY